MLFLTYWELNEEMTVEERHEVTKKVTGEENFPPDGVEILRWDITNNMWGIVLWEADDYRSIHKAINMWRQARGGFFNEIKTEPAAPVQEHTEYDAELIEELS